METIIVSLITSAFTLAGVVITVVAQGKRNKADREADFEKQQQKINDTLSDKFTEMEHQLEKHEAVSNGRIDALTKQVEKHNGVIERTYKLEQDSLNLFHRFDETKRVADEAHENALHARERADAAHRRLDRSGADHN